MVKSLTNLRRRLGFLLFQFSLPVVQIVLFCVCIGGDPFGLRLAVVNWDVDGGLGARLVQCLDNRTFDKVPFLDLEAARAHVRGAHAWAVLRLGQNFTSSLYLRLLSPLLLTNASLSESSVHLELDNSNYQVSMIVRSSVAEAFQQFAGELLAERGLQPTLASLPVEARPLLGGQNPSFTEFMAPGMIISIVFFMATGLTALSFVMERKEGLWDRSLVAGMSMLEMMLGHMLTELLILVGQTGVLLFFCLVVFRIPCQGSVLLVILLALANGFTGMSLGLVISVLCTAETSAIQASLGTMYPNLLLSGVLWPAEAMPWFLRHMSRLLPTTLSVEAMRSVVSRGFGITSAAVWLGLLSSLTWSCVLLILTMILLRIRGD